MSDDDRRRSAELLLLDHLVRAARQDLETLQNERDRLRAEAQHEALDHVLDHPEESRVHVEDLRELGDEAWLEVREALAEFRARLVAIIHRDKT